MTVANDHEGALKHLDLEIEKARIAANAEAAYDAANGREGPNPWANASRALEDLEQDRRQLDLKLKGRALTEAHERLQGLNREIEKARVEREAADRVLAERKENPTVQRYHNASSISMKLGWGHSWSLFRTWYESGKPRYTVLSEESSFFVDSPLAQDAGVSFNLDGEREAVRLYVEAMDASNKALMNWSSLAELRAALLREHPELRGVA